MTNKIATEQYLINLAGGGTNTPTKCATRDRVEFFGLETNDNYANNQLVKEEEQGNMLQRFFPYVLE